MLFFLKSSRFSRWKILITTIYVQFNVLMRTPKRRIALGNLNIMPILGTFGTGPHWALCKKTLTLILTPDCKPSQLSTHFQFQSLYFHVFPMFQLSFPQLPGSAVGCQTRKEGSPSRPEILIEGEEEWKTLRVPGRLWGCLFNWNFWKWHDNSSSKWDQAHTTSPSSYCAAAWQVSWGPPGLGGVVCHSKRADENLRAIVLRKKMNQNDSKWHTYITCISFFSFVQYDHCRTNFEWSVSTYMLLCESY